MRHGNAFPLSQRRTPHHGDFPHGDPRVRQALSGQPCEHRGLGEAGTRHPLDGMVEEIRIDQRTLGPQKLAALFAAKWDRDAVPRGGSWLQNWSASWAMSVRISRRKPDANGGRFA